LTVTAVKINGQISHFVGVFVDMTERKLAEEEIRRLAFFDPLTLLPNRRLLLDRLQVALGQSYRNQNYGALMFLDLDHFKVINDTRGHAYGDEILIEVAHRLTKCVRDTDTTARLGGDEFVVLLEGLSNNQDDAATQASVIAEKIRESLSQSYLVADHIYISTTSIGVVLFSGEDIEIDEVFKRADMAMYQAKEAGRNSVRFFEPAMQTMLDSRAVLESALRQAISGDELELFYQLQTNRNKELCGAEVLLRWHSKTLGMISPAQFIPLAEQTKLILPIGRWVLETACSCLKQWESHPVLCMMTLAVNISPIQFHRTDFVSEVKSIISDSGANPKRLELELTENLVLEDVDEAIRKMAELKEMGLRFSMDDFGTGYSSLQYIKSLPIDRLKIDQSFVRDILTDPGDAMMVQTIVSMARNFGYEVIAEGVEEEAQIPSLIDRGCEMFQGYFFSRPIALVDFEKLIGEWQVERFYR
jgi:diguanylate cyclase (GGDEF)-like protein